MDNLNNSKYKVGDTFDISLPGGQKIRFCWIPPGSFRMGSRGYRFDEEPVHDVKITRGFWMAETPVTQAQWMNYVTDQEKQGITRYEFWNQGKFSFENSDYPATDINYWEAWMLCYWLNEYFLEQLPSGFITGLQTEAEWEYSCRAGTETEFYTGDGKVALEKAGWFRDNSDNQHQSVKQKEKNAFGLYDMHGNIFEWFADIWDAEAYKKWEIGYENSSSRELLNMAICRDGESFEQMGIWRPNLSDDCLILGGSWDVEAVWCCSAFRSWAKPDYSFYDHGCRLVCVRRLPEVGENGAPDLDAEEAGGTPSGNNLGGERVGV